MKQLIRTILIMETYKIEEPYASEMIQRLKESKTSKEEPKKFNYKAIWKE